MSYIKIPQLLCFEKNAILEISEFEEVDLMKMNTSLFNMVSDKPIEDYNKPVEAEILGVYTVKNTGELVYVDHVQMLKDGVISFLDKKIVDKDNCIFKEGLNNIVDDSEHDSIKEFCDEYLRDSIEIKDDKDEHILNKLKNKLLETLK